MPKIKKTKTKIKQKQRQSQSVVVNIHNKRTASRRKAPTRRGSGSVSSGVPYPIYLNSSSDYAPIIHNLPTQFQNTSAITLPVKALANIPTGTKVDYPTATQLQTNTEDSRPLVVAPSPIRNIKPATPTTAGKNRLTPFQVELQEAITERASRQPTPIAFTGEPATETPFLIRPVARRLMSSPSFGVVGPIQSPSFGIESIFTPSQSPFMEINPQIPQVPKQTRRLKIQMQEARLMEKEDRPQPKNPVGRPVKIKPIHP